VDGGSGGTLGEFPGSGATGDHVGLWGTACLTIKGLYASGHIASTSRARLGFVCTAACTVLEALHMLVLDVVPC
jgi:hypothetical protein